MLTPQRCRTRSIHSATGASEPVESVAILFLTLWMLFVNSHLNIGHLPIYIYIYSNRCFRCRAFCQHGVLPTTGPSYRSGAPMARPGAASLMESLNDFCGQAVGGLESPWRGTDSLARSGTDSGLKARGAVFVVFFHTNLGCLS